MMSTVTSLTDAELAGLVKVLKPLLSATENEIERREWSRMMAEKQDQDTNWPDALETTT